MECKKCGEPLVFINTDKTNGLVGYYKCYNDCDNPLVTFRTVKGYRKVEFDIDENPLYKYKIDINENNRK